MSPAATTTAPSTLSEHLVRPVGKVWAYWRQIALRSAGFPASRILELADPALVEAAERLLAAGEEGAGRDRLQELRARYREVHEEALVRQSETLYEAARDPRLQEAVLWQSRSVFRTGVGKLAQKPPQGRPNSDRRRKEALVASYLQRYCVKNDTISFFGPSGWARLSDDGPRVRQRPGEGLLAERRTFLEDWGIDALARHLAVDPAVRPSLHPRLLPHVVLRGRRLFLPQRPPEELDPPVAAVLAACDGRRSAADLAADLMAAGDVPGEGAVSEILERLAADGLVAWSFEVPMGPHAPEVMRRQVGEIDDDDARRRAEAALDELEEARRRVAEAAGDPARLDEAIGDLEERFTRLTGDEATRRAGRTYGARTLVYEECRRDVELELGPEWQRDVAEPLSLVLRSARWLISRTAQEVGALFRGIHGEMAQRTGSPVVEAGQFWGGVAPFLFGPRREVLAAAVPELQERWGRLLDVGPGVRRIEVASDDLKPLVEEAFPRLATGWPAGRWHSPDVMVAADGPQALRDGDYSLVLGELHLGRNTLNSWGLMAICPHRQEAFAAMDEDLPEPQVVPLPPRENPRVTGRTHAAHLSDKDFFIPPADGSVSVPEERAVSFADLVVEAGGEGLTVRSRDGAKSFDAVHFFSEFIALGLGTSLSLLAAGDHRPRVVVDRLVIQRESWSFPLEDLAFAGEKRLEDRFLGARRWARDANLPRFVFYREPGEMKPFYLDLDSPVYVELLAKSVRRGLRRAEDGEGEAPRLAVSEMLPTPHQAWLEDADGRRYTSELRMVVVEGG